MAIILATNGKERIDIAKKINCKLYGVHCEARTQCRAAAKKMLAGMSQDDAFKNFTMPCDKYQD